MAIRDLRRLFEAIGRRDWDTATGAAKVIAKAEADRGNHGAARTLEDALTTRELSAALPVSMVKMNRSRLRVKTHAYSPD